MVYDDRQTEEELCRRWGRTLAGQANTIAALLRDLRTHRGQCLEGQRHAFGMSQRAFRAFCRLPIPDAAQFGPELRQLALRYEATHPDVVVALLAQARALRRALDSNAPALTDQPVADGHEVTP
jgi:hypothetical protein